MNGKRYAIISHEFGNYDTTRFEKEFDNLEEAERVKKELLVTRESEKRLYLVIDFQAFDKDDKNEIL